MVFTPDVAESLTLRPEVPGWLVDHYALVDAADLEGYGKHFADDVTLTFGALPSVHGKAAVLKALRAGHDRYAMQHTFRHVWDAHGHVMIQFEARFTFPDGRVEVMPTMAVIRHDAHVISSLQVFIDRLPLAPSS
ncbi:nuclear transport factor 2 family protein [Streptomyces sp. NPDC029041]|uniref:nuclear transport factor 2 family protein n=1 Tax=Streptomyces sp. NPDC029041 TaxID=3155727 RepID=UPI0033ECF4B4